LSYEAETFNTYGHVDWEYLANRNLKTAQLYWVFAGLVKQFYCMILFIHYNIYSYRGETRNVCGSGFVGTLTIRDTTVTVLVTNNHVFPTMEKARSATFQFGYQTNSQIEEEMVSSQPEEIKGETLIDEKAQFITNKVSVNVIVRNE